MQVRDAVKASITEKITGATDRISRPGVSYVTYQQLVGRIQGLRDALESVDEVFTKLVDDQDD